MAGKFGRRPFRPLGLRLQRISRKHILNYIAPTEGQAADELPPSWKADAETPLNWGIPENYAPPTQPAAPIESFPAQQPSQQPAMPVQRTSASPAQQPADSRLPADLLRLMQIHEGRRERLRQEAEQRRAQRLADENAIPKPPPLTQRHRASFEYVRPLVQDDESTTSPQDDNAPDDWSDEDNPEDVNTEGDVQAALPSLTTPTVQPSRDEATNQPDETSSDDVNTEGDVQAALPSLTTPTVQPSRDETTSQPDETNSDNSSQATPPETYSPPFETAAPPAKRELGDSVPPVQRTALDVAPSPNPPSVPQPAVTLPPESEGIEAPASSQSSFDAASATPDQSVAQHGEGETQHRVPQPNTENLSPLSQSEIVRRTPESQGTPPLAPPLQRRETAPVTPNAQPIRRERETAPTPSTIRRLPARRTPSTPAAASPESLPQSVQRFGDVEAGTPLTQPGEPSISSPDASRESTTPQPVRWNVASSSQRTIQRLPAKSAVFDATRSIQPTPTESGVSSGEGQSASPEPTGVPHAPSSGVSETAPQLPPSQPSPTVQRVIENAETLPDTSAAHQVTSQVDNVPSEPAQNTAQIDGMPSGQATPTPPQAPIVHRSLNEPSSVGQAAPPAETSLVHSLQSPEIPRTTSTASVQRMPESQTNQPLAPSRTQRTAAPPTVQRITTSPEPAQTEQAGWRFAAEQRPSAQALPAQPPRPSTLPEMPMQTHEAPAQREIQRAPEPMVSSMPDAIPVSFSPEATSQHEIQRAPEQQLAHPQPSTEMVVQDTEPAWHPPVTPPAQTQPAVQRVPEPELPQPAVESAESTPQRGNVQRVAAMPSPVEMSSVETPATPPADHEAVVREVDTGQAADTPMPTGESIASTPPISETGLQRTPEPASQVQPVSGAQAVGADMPVAPPAPTSQQPEVPATVHRVVEQPAASPVREIPPETISTTAAQPGAVPTVAPQRTRPQTKQPTIQRVASGTREAQPAGASPQQRADETAVSLEAQPSDTSPKVTPAPVSMQRQAVSTSADSVSPAPMTPQAKPNVRRVPAKLEQAEVVSPTQSESVAADLHAQIPNATTDAVSQPTIQRDVDAQVSDTADEDSGILSPVDTPTTTVATPPHTPPATRRVAEPIDTPANAETTPGEISNVPSPQAAPVNIQRTHRQLTPPSSDGERTIRRAAANLALTTESTRETAPTIERISAVAGEAASNQHVQRLGQTQASSSPSAEQGTSHVTRVVQREASSSPTTARRVMFGGERSESVPVAESPFKERSAESVSSDLQPSGSVQRSTATPAAPVTSPLETRQPAPLNAFEAYARASAVSDVATPAVQRAPLSGEPQAVDEDFEAADTMPQNLYEAMVSSGMLPISSMPQSGGESGIMRRAIPRDPRVSSAITEMPSSIRQAEQAVVPDANSTEAELLGLLGLPPDTPVVGMKSTPPAPAVQRTPDVSPSEPSAPAVQRASVAPDSESDTPRDLQPAPQPDVTPTPPAQVQRAIVDTTEDTQSEAHDGAGEGQGAEVDIEKLAQQVFSILRQRLRIERERRDR